MEAITVFYPPTRRLSPCSSHFVLLRAPHYSSHIQFFFSSPLSLTRCSRWQKDCGLFHLFRSKAPNLSALSVCTRNTIFYSRKESCCVRLDLSFMAFKAIFWKVALLNHRADCHESIIPNNCIHSLLLCDMNFNLVFFKNWVINYIEQNYETKF